MRIIKYLQRKALITTVQQVRECRLWYCLFTHHQVYLQRKALITTVQQVRESRLWYSLFAHHQVPAEEGAYNHSLAGESAGHGILFLRIIKYLQKKALIITVQQVRECRSWYCRFANHQVPPEEGAYNHGSADERVQVIVLSFFTSLSNSRGRRL